MSKRKKILILGVTGQDGSFMAKLMLEKNFIVHGMVRKSSTGNLGNIKELLYDKKFTIKGAIEELKRSSNEGGMTRKVQSIDKSVLEEVRDELKSILNELNRH